MKRHFILDEGKVYENKNGGAYRCIGMRNDFAYLVNVKSHWRFIAHTITMYDDGTIEWDYSTNGFFEK